MFCEARRVCDASQPVGSLNAALARPAHPPTNPSTPSAGTPSGCASPRNPPSRDPCEPEPRHHAKHGTRVAASSAGAPSSHGSPAHASSLSPPPPLANPPAPSTARPPCVWRPRNAPALDPCVPGDPRPATHGTRVATPAAGAPASHGPPAPSAAPTPPPPPSNRQAPSPASAPCAWTPPGLRRSGARARPPPSRPGSPWPCGAPIGVCVVPSLRAWLRVWGLGVWRLALSVES